MFSSLKEGIFDSRFTQFGIKDSSYSTLHMEKP